ncbi:MAG: acylneuraminate cytidylyltransferase family protein [Planctomycetes bacterium]|nr:acylneuraminate cytidylyltransferase family protein [Planctomycetota bacterium]
MPEAWDLERAVGLVLARGGSRGIPRKNLSVVAGLPLVARAVRTLRAVPEIRRVIVSTDDPEIAAVARDYGAETPFLRPAALAAEDTPSLRAIEHAAAQLTAAGERAALMVHVQATSPCCRPQHVAEALAAFRAAPGADYLRSVTPVTEHPHWMGRVRGGRFEFLYSAAERASRRQDLPAFYRLNGAIGILRVERILAGRGETGEMTPYIMSEDDSADIDNAADLRLAEELLTSQS